LNRGVGRMRLFENDGDYEAFELRAACASGPPRKISYRARLVDPYAVLVR